MLGLLSVLLVPPFDLYACSCLAYSHLLASDALFTVQQIKRRGIQRQLRSCQRKRMIYVNDVAEYTREFAAVIDDFATRLLPGVD